MNLTTKHAFTESEVKEVQSRYPQWAGELVSVYLAKRQFSDLVLLMPSGERLTGFWAVAHKLTNDEYWATGRLVWEVSQVIAPHWDEWRYYFYKKRGNRSAMMDEQEQAVFAKLPERVKIYRGCHAPDGVKGYSWTLSKRVAENFAELSCSSNAVVAEGECRKKDVKAYLDGRDEKEILVFPEHVKRIRLAPHQLRPNEAIVWE